MFKSFIERVLFHEMMSATVFHCLYWEAHAKQYNTVNYILVLMYRITGLSDVREIKDDRDKACSLIHENSEKKTRKFLHAHTSEDPMPLQAIRFAVEFRPCINETFDYMPFVGQTSWKTSQFVSPYTNLAANNVKSSYLHTQTQLCDNHVSPQVETLNQFIRGTGK